jgi:GMP synthase (glutamine-hydrolysing)
MTIAILDFGSQYTQLIARRIRELGVYSEIFPWDAPAEKVLAVKPTAFVLSGGPNSIYDPGAPTLPAYVLAQQAPTLGICYGMQALAQALEGHVLGSSEREYGRAVLQVTHESTLLPPAGTQIQIWASHGDKVDRAPAGFRVVASSDNCPIAAMEDPARRLYAIQFHPEVNHTEGGRAILERFLSAAGVARTWTPGSMVDEAVAKIRAQVGDAPVIAGVSGGVDSSVAAALVQRAVGDQLTCIFVDTGMLRAGEPEAVVRAFREHLGARLVAVNAAEEFLDALGGVTDPEDKRKIIGEKFIRIFEREARRALDGAEGRFLVQGTIYPDVIESRGPERQSAAKIKSHHNVGGLPADLNFALVEPLRYMFKDEVRAVGDELGLPESLVWRQPFPGPGLAVRCLGDITWERLEVLRAADKIATDELAAAGFIRGKHSTEPAAASQAFVVLLPVRSVGVMGDGRTYHETAALRAVTTDDFMTADWARLPYDLLARISSRIVNEVKGINRVVYDISSKPPATIEWE